MELRIPTPEELRRIYEEEMKSAFPPSELKPLSAIERMWREGRYKPYCLYDDDGAGPLGTAFLWLGHDGWGLLDYLCVTAGWRNDGFGSLMLRLLPQAEPGMVIFGEAEAPDYAPDPAMAERRLGFYTRNGLRTAGYETEIFGVHYKTLYLTDREIEDAVLMEEHRFVYGSSFTPEKYAKHIRIPYDPAHPCAQVPWDQ